MIGSRRRVAGRASLAALFVLLIGGRTAAQTSGGNGGHTSEAQAAPGFLTNYRFHLNATRFVAPRDVQFAWDVDIGADLDVFDLGFAHGNVLANFEAIVGGEFRSIDPNQGNYIIDLSLWFRPGGGELGGVFHHVSRHLSDRPNLRAISWNMLGAEYIYAGTLGWADLAGGIRALKTLQRSSVDYAGEIGAHTTLAGDLHPRLAVIFGLDGTVVPVKSAVYGRDTLAGWRMESGVRIRGRTGALELFVGREQRIDAAPIARETARWTQIGFRFVSH